MSEEPRLERLNKLLARSGVSSRRGADALIAAGRVSVNGSLVTDLGAKVDPRRDTVCVDGGPIDGPEPLVYVAVYKPRHVITTVRDPHGRPSVGDLVEVPGRLFPIGRLDGASEGLILLSNDGNLAHRLLHPRHGHEREYRVKISGTPTDVALSAWRQGMYLDDGRTLPAVVRIESSSGGGTWLRWILREGRNRQIRRMVEAFHHRVHRLIRVRMGPVELGTLKPGEWRYLEEREIASLADPARTPAQSAGGSGGRVAYKKGWARPKKRKTRPRSGRGGRGRTGQ